MVITVYHILFDDMFVAETGVKEKVESIIEKLIKDYSDENKVLRKELKEFEENFKDVYGPRKNDNAETYRRFIMNNYPELYDKFCFLGHKIFKEYHVSGEYFYSNENFGWNVVDGQGKSWMCGLNEAYASLLLDVSRRRFSVKEVEIEIM